MTKNKKYYKKLKSYFVSNRIIIISFMCIMLVFSTVLILQRSLITNITEGDNVDKDYNYITSTYSIGSYDEVFFVSTNGDDTTGLTLAKAFHSIVSALEEASTDPQSNSLIILSAGDHDVNLPGDPTYSCNIHIVGSDDRKSMLTNTHNDSTSVLTLSGKVEISNLRIYGNGECGIKFTGASAIIKNVAFVGLYSTTTSTLVCYESVGIVIISYSEFIGDAGSQYITLVKLNNSALFEIEYTGFFFGIKGLDLYDASYGSIHDCTFGEIGTAYTADSECNDLLLEATHFRNNDVNVLDLYNTTFVDQEHTYVEQELRYQLPSTIVGIEITGHLDANTFGNWTTITNSVDKKFKVLGVVVHDTNDVNTLYYCELGIGQPGSEISIVTLMFHGELKFAETHAIFSGYLNNYERVSMRIKTDNGASDTLETNLHISEL